METKQWNHLQTLYYIMTFGFLSSSNPCLPHKYSCHWLVYKSSSLLLTNNNLKKKEKKEFHGINSYIWIWMKSSFNHSCTFLQSNSKRISASLLGLSNETRWISVFHSTKYRLLIEYKLESHLKTQRYRVHSKTHSALK